MLNTDWGDEGHFNMLATSWHAIYLGAAMAWNPSAPSAEAFDRAFSVLGLHDASGRGLAALRGVLAVGESARSWPLLAAPFAGPSPAASDFDADRLREWRRRALDAAELFSARSQPERLHEVLAVFRRLADEALERGGLLDAPPPRQCNRPGGA